jgi:hypothetical protein
MVLTGLATEQTFDKKGAPQFFLVFNNGALRVPVTEEAAGVVVKEMYGSPFDDMPDPDDEEAYLPKEQQAQPEGAPDEEEVVPQRYEEDTDEDGVSSI